MNNCPDRKMAATFWSNAAPLIPGEHLLLAAVKNGLSACRIGYLDARKASRILNLPEDSVRLFLLPVCYANEEPQDIYKRTIEEIVFYDRL